MERNIGPEGSLKVDADIGWVQVLDYRGEPIEYLPIAFHCLASHENPSTGYINTTRHVKDHDY